MQSYERINHSKLPEKNILRTKELNLFRFSDYLTCILILLFRVGVGDIFWDFGFYFPRKQMFDKVDPYIYLSLLSNLSPEFHPKNSVWSSVSALCPTPPHTGVLSKNYRAFVKQMVSPPADCRVSRLLL
jgi:hypothetical protein